MEYCNINIYVSKPIHDRLMQEIKQGRILSTPVTKATVVELGLSHLFSDMDTTNKTLEDYAGEHLTTARGEL